MALTVAQILKLRAAGAIRVSETEKGLSVEFGPLPGPAAKAAQWHPSAPDVDDDEAPAPRRARDALEVAQSFNGPIPNVIEDA